MPPVRVPKPKLDLAREYQRRVRQEKGVLLPLWRCLVEMEQPEQRKQPKTMFRGGFKL